MSDEDRALVAQALEGSDRAFNQIVDRHEQAVRGFLRRLMGSTADAEDVAQETFLAAWENLRLYRGGASLRSWLCAIAWRKARTAQRSWFRGRGRDADYQGARATDGERGTPVEDQLAVRQALMALPIEQRAAVALCLADGFSHAEAAEILGAPLGTVKSHVTRGKARLLKALSEIPERHPWQDDQQGDRG